MNRKFAKGALLAAAVAVIGYTGANLTSLGLDPAVSGVVAALLGAIGLALKAEVDD